MSRMTLNRRDFLRLSAGAAAGASLMMPFLSRVQAQAAASLRFVTWDGEEELPIERNIVAEFNKQFPNITVSVESVPQNYDDKLLAGLAAGSAPDVWLWWNTPKLASRNALEDLGPWVKGDSPVDMSLYYENCVKYNSLGDTLYMLPHDFTSRVIFYNKKLFDDAKIPYPTADWTWKDLEGIAKELTKGDGPDKQYGWFSWSADYPLQTFVWSNGGDFISPDGKMATGYLDSAATIEAVDWYVRMQTDLGVSPTATAQTTIGDGTTLFSNNKLAMFEQGHWPESQFKSVKGLEFGTVLPPKSPTTGKLVTTLHSAGWALNPNSKDKKDAWELLKALSLDVAQKARGEGGWGLPAMPSVAKAIGFLDDPIEKVWYDAVPLATVAPCFFRNANWEKAETEINNAISAAFLGQTSIEDGFKAAAPIVDGILQAT